MLLIHHGVEPPASKKADEFLLPISVKVMPIAIVGGGIAILGVLADRGMVDVIVRFLILILSWPIWRSAKLG